MIDFKRIIHPIGLGAFFTEQFYDTYPDKPLFNVVYDCGSFSGGKYYAPSILKKEINKTFNKTDHIDFLFISHFDGDHTNGLDYLLESTTMDENTYVFIPFKYPYLLLQWKTTIQY